MAPVSRARSRVPSASPATALAGSAIGYVRIGDTLLHGVSLGNIAELCLESADFFPQNLILRIAPGKLILSVNNPESGSATEEMALDYEGEALEIGFNARYLMDIATQFEGERATFKMSDPSAPTLLQDEGDTSALYVLMPMRV